MEKNIEKQTQVIVEAYYEYLNKKDYEAIVQLFADQIEWRIPGDASRAVWTKDRNSKKEVLEFFKELYENIEGVSYEVTGKFYSGNQAVVTGHLVSRVLKTNKLFDSFFSVQFQVDEGCITKYLFLEDSHALMESLK